MALSLFSAILGLYILHVSLALIILNKDVSTSRGMLYPRDSETREVRSLDGMWNFVPSDETNPTQGIRDQWYKDDLNKVREVIGMPVPASYNDITTEQSLRDHVGTVWYDRKFFVPRSWAKDQRVWLRFGSVHYEAFVWVNGELAVKHEMGHLPFEAEVTHLLKYGSENRITVMCDNALIQTTVPQGKISEVANDNGVSIVQSYSFDFFNYAGIHRSVHLYTTPKTFIEEVEINTDLANDNSLGYVYYTISVNGSAANEADNALYARVQLYNREGEQVANATSDAKLSGMLQVEKVKPWWPYLMHPDPGYLYELEIELHAANEELLDVYRLNVGIRTLSWTNTTFNINGKPVYFRGFGRHEDADVRGKGLDYALLTRDFNLLRWIGANAYRTSHYPYSEESMQFADRHGIMIIDECPSVDTENYNQALLGKHKSSLEQLIHRDRNHPSVVMWSIANEPRTQQMNADTYFQFVATFTRSLDSTRPITAAIAVPSSEDKAARYLDIVSFNRYNAWYSNPGRLDMITKRVIDEATAWHKKCNKPVIMSEYGADTLEGLHLQPSYVWSEEYQTDLFSRHFKAFDALRRQKWFIGEFVWNFADFKTAQTYTRVAGNKKGVFTRARQPKAVAHLLRKRYFALGREMDQCSFPDDLFTYIAEPSESGKHDSTDL
ncbi:beta-glucuronidase-like isoform X1 [Scaptodrosophila lebanonensis]|uniref:Beta-glucuronidase n=1 Tax=Drosophila lebanonensis TaxID=7225 RepID=A0A6J2UF16_DROLE|nr:beta-glucuronidase-like isoform X1 [Scaptodrosophila lebanonensis]